MALLLVMALVVAAVVVAVAGSTAVVGRRAGADETTTSVDPTTVDTTTSSTDGSTTTTGTDSSSTTDSSDTGSSTSSTTTVVAPGASTTLPAGDGGEQDVGSSFGPQAAFNPASKTALPKAIAQAKAQKAQADTALAQARSDQVHAQVAVSGFEAQTRGLSTADRARFERALRARQLLTEQAVAAYVQGGAGASVDLLGSASPSDLSTGMEMLDSVLEQLEAQSRAYTSDRAGLSRTLRARLDQGLSISEDLSSAQTTVATATQVDQAAEWQLESFENNSHVWVPGFIFPVAGPTRFVDSFGDARLSGTSEQHWHEGCDVMAATGSPLVAVEDGVLSVYGGSDPLGGLSLFLKGTSGYSYYYAHLSAFAPGLAQGDHVTAGQLIGFVGQTGDALAPHVHFEIHDPDGQVLDAYGLLKTAWSARQAALALPPGDPANPPTDLDPGTPGGFPRAPDGSPVGVGPPISLYPPD
jgi:murein DD-endopeptidase MepM/ murein hydrolase activator NlpD